MFDEVKTFTNNEKIYVTNFLKQKQVPFTKNRNGYHFNLTDVPDQIILEIKKCMKQLYIDRDINTSLNNQRRNTLQEYTKFLEESTMKIKLEQEQEFKKRYTITYPITRVIITPRPLYKSCECTWACLCRDPDNLMEIEYKRKHRQWRAYKLCSRIKKTFNTIKECNSENDRDDDLGEICDIISNGGGGDIEDEIEELDNIEEDYDLSEDECDLDDDYEEDKRNYSDVVFKEENTGISDFVLSTSVSRKEFRIPLKKEIDEFRNKLIKLGFKFKIGNHDELVFLEN